MLSYSGHGGTLPDQNSDETDQTDETWCLYNRELVDDELKNYLAEFKDGVRILVFSDSCHSGTVTKVIAANKNIDMMNTNTDINKKRYRFAPINIIRKTYRLNKSQYDKILSNPKLKESEDKIKAFVILLSGCQDNQYSQDGEFNGLFTSNLLDVWNNALFDKSYKRFHKAILRQMPPDQTPNYYIMGNINKNFENQIPLYNLNQFFLILLVIDRSRVIVTFLSRIFNNLSIPHAQAKNRHLFLVDLVRHFPV